MERRLTKTLYRLADGCPMGLWLTIHRPDLKAPLSLAARDRMKTGQEVGALARKRFEGAKFVRHWEMTAEAATGLTLDLVRSDSGVILEATFATEGLLARTDILSRTGAGWKITEVKSSGEYKKDEHLTDVAFQTWVAQRCGLKVESASVMHLRKDYKWRGGEHDVQELFSEVDITEEVEAELPRVEASVPGFLGLWDRPDYPTELDPGIRPACRDCGFGEHCMALAPEDHIFYLNLHHSRVKKLKQQGITLVEEIPPDFVTDPKERLRYEARLTKEPQVDPSLVSELARIVYPALLIDFETMRPALPIIPGTSPFTLLPFQWSCHRLARSPRGSAVLDIESGHSEFLYEGQDDPRPEFCRTLYEAIKEGGSILVYSNYEESTLKQLAAENIPYAAELLALVPERFVDLEKIVRQCYADHRFEGRTSIKAVLPVVAPDFRYEDLDIHDGDQAQIEYRQTFDPACPPEERRRVYDALKAYCKLDTWAMVLVLKALYERAMSGPQA
ncbi:MAG: DUF2779 domain-containing protein [Fimbriimonadales bacterium]